jgi:hypothetical protein
VNKTMNHRIPLNVRKLWVTEQLLAPQDRLHGFS